MPTYPRYSNWSFNPSCSQIYPKTTVPFFTSAFGTRTHRIRWVCVHYWNGEFSHTSVGLWCGQQGFAEHTKSTNARMVKRAGSMADVAPFHLPVCATCEGRAIGAGQLDSDMINGRKVIYSPRIPIGVPVQQETEAAKC